MSTLLSINNYHYPRGGAEMIYLNHNRLFERLGWHVVPFAMRHSLNLPNPYDSYFVDEIEFGNEYSWIDKVRRLPKVIYSLEAREKLARLLDKASPDICHAHNIYHHISPSILSLLKTRQIPVVLTLHDLKLACPAYTMLATDGICERCKGGNHRHLIANRCIKNSLPLSAVVYAETKLHKWLDSYVANVSRLVSPSQFVMTKMIEWGIPREMLVHIPNSIPFSTYDPERTVGKYFLYVGRLGPEKGLATLLEAAIASRSHLIIAGRGPEETRLKAMAASSQGRIEFTGFLSGEPLYQLIRGARAVVLPSEWYENAPVSILEAYREGIPVIGADVGGIPEMLRHGSTGALFPSRSAEGLTEVLSSFEKLSDRSIRELGDAGRRLLETEYSEDSYYQKVTELYCNLDVRTNAIAHSLADRSCT